MGFSTVIPGSYGEPWFIWDWDFGCWVQVSP